MADNQRTTENSDELSTASKGPTLLSMLMNIEKAMSKQGADEAADIEPIEDTIPENPTLEFQEDKDLHTRTKTEKSKSKSSRMQSVACEALYGEKKTLFRRKRMLPRFDGEESEKEPPTKRSRNSTSDRILAGNLKKGKRIPTYITKQTSRNCINNRNNIKTFLST